MGRTRKLLKTWEEPKFQRGVAREFMSTDADVEGLEVKRVNKVIGKGLFATKTFQSGDFLCEYAGDLITEKEGKRRETSYPMKLGSFLFFFRWKGKRYCVDATLKKNRKCRYANDAAGPQKNGVMLLDVFNETPHLCLYAAKQITPGEEIRYDYGVTNLPWRLVRNELYEVRQKQALFKHIHVFCINNKFGRILSLSTFVPFVDGSF
ncbi:N-lysine methyltransferase KMT5A-like [Argopecten irradians]|uniref:N-lysine methyltransferase KMT5A-like n=1 Tax=Argopecten irradians TaxID=31199 RepID=UPI0037134EAD